MEKMRRFPDEPISAKRPPNFTTDAHGAMLRLKKVNPENLPSLIMQGMSAKEMPKQRSKLAGRIRKATNAS